MMELSTDPGARSRDRARPLHADPPEFRSERARKAEHLPIELGVALLRPDEGTLTRAEYYERIES